MIKFSFDTTEVKELQEALAYGEKAAAQGLWHGVGASLGALRREFLKATLVQLGNASPKREYKGMNPNPMSLSRRGIVFRWDRTPKRKEQVKAMSDVGGSFFTTSTAAESLELGSTNKPKSSRFLTIPMLQIGRPNTAKKRKDSGRLQVNRSWKDIPTFIEKHSKNYKWEIERRGSYRIMYVRRAYKQKKREMSSAWFPAFLIIRSVKMPALLDFYKFFDGFQPEIEKRFKRELSKVVKEMALPFFGRRRKGRR